VPFAAPEEALGYLESRREAGALTLFDDGEKFGVWPGTHRLAYGEGWLSRFFEALVAAPWLRMSTFAAYLDAAPPAGAVYLPTASYTEMGEWALPAAAAQELEETRRRLEALPDGARLTRLLRGGFWRNFLVKYPEMGDAYATMLALSRRLHEALRARPDDPRLQAAREDLWRGQANDAYWHGVFGGVYLPHLRSAVWRNLLAAERGVSQSEGELRLEVSDYDLDGSSELLLEAPAQNAYLSPAQGGAVVEWDVNGRNAADCMARREDRAHELPAPRPRRAVPLRDATWLLLLHNHQVLLERRPGAGLWGGLWTFPVASNAGYAAQARELGCEISSARELEPLEHGFTHFRLRIRPVLCGVARTLPRAAAPGRLWIDLEDAAQAAAPTPVKKLIARLGASNASW